MEICAKFEGHRFLESGDVSRPGTNSMSLGGSPRVDQCICFSFYPRISIWKFMAKPLVNVFSKLAIFQGPGPTPHDQEDLQGWPNAFAFPSIVNYQFGNLCPNLWSTFSRNWRCLKTWDQIHEIRRISKGGLTHLLSFLSSIICLEIYAQTFGQRFLETGDISRPGTNST